MVTKALSEEPGPSRFFDVFYIPGEPNGRGLAPMPHMLPAQVELSGQAHRKRRGVCRGFPAWVT